MTARRFTKLGSAAAIQRKLKRGSQPTTKRRGTTFTRLQTKLQRAPQS